MGDAFGIPFHPYRPCAFLQGKCLVYDFRPQVCRKFYCAYSQGLFPEWMRPDKTNVLISVQDWSKGQYLKVIACGTEIIEKVHEEIRKFSQQNLCPYMVIDHENKTSIYGPKEFLAEIQ